MIEVQNVSKSFNGTQILKNVSTVFEEGKVNCIIGRSGSGKTVLMKSIANKMKPFCITFKNIWFRQKGLSCSGRWIKPFWKPYKQNRTLLHIIKNITFKQWCLSECLIWRSRRILQQMFSNSFCSFVCTQCCWFRITFEANC